MFTCNIIIQKNGFGMNAALSLLNFFKLYFLSLVCECGPLSYSCYDWPLLGFLRSKVSPEGCRGWSPIKSH